MSTYYISGPMRGYEHYNFPAFFECEEYLKKILAPEAEVISPAAKDIAEGFVPEFEEVTKDQLANWMRRDVSDVAASTDIVLLPGWERSEGARRELSVAKWCGVLPWTYDPDDVEYQRLSARSWDELAKLCNKADAEKAAAIDLPCQRGCTTFTGECNQSGCNGKPADFHVVEGTDEVRTVSATGGEKGVKPERHDLVPVGPMDDVARVYAFGAEKYDDHNWRKGYEWGKSYAALQRHLRAFWSGNDEDDESGLPHLAHAAFHLFALLEWSGSDSDQYAQFDDRYLQ